MEVIDNPVPDTQNSSEVLFDDTPQFVDHSQVILHKEQQSNELIEEEIHTEIGKVHTEIEYVETEIEDVHTEIEDVHTEIEDVQTEIEEQSETVEHEEELEENSNNLSSKQSAESHEGKVRLPLSRIKTIMKTDPDVAMTSQETAVLIAKATELFVQELTKEVFSYTLQAKRKTVQRKDLELAIDRIDSLAFLEGTMEF